MVDYLPQGKATQDQVDHIYQHIKNHPGVGVKEISKQLAIGFIAVRTGVNYLTDAGKVKKQQTSDRTVKLFAAEE